MEKSNIYLRADGNKTIGLGHVSRCLALAEMLHQYFNFHFIIQEPSKELETEILKYCASIVTLPLSDDYLGDAAVVKSKINRASAIVVLDGYKFKSAYQLSLKKSDITLICIDDLYDHEFYADAIINHAGGVGVEDYSKQSYTRLYLGLSYALLKKPFRDVAAIQPSSSNSKNNLLICMGGADPNGDIFEVLDQVKTWPPFDKVWIVIGSGFAKEELLREYLHDYECNYELLSNLSAEEMVCVMDKCNTAVLPPSTMSYEYMSTGGLLILKQIADNQENIKNYLLDEKLAINFDSIDATKSILRFDFEKFKKRQRVLFDGKQSKRFLKVIQELMLSCREVREADCALLFEWANDISTRQQSFSSDEIPYEDHVAWFSSKIANPQALMLIATLDQKPVGQIRFDRDNLETTISYSLDKAYRGRGLGVQLLAKGIEYAESIGWELKNLTGLVKQNNIPSIKAFQSLGFKESAVDDPINTLKFMRL